MDTVQPGISIQETLGNIAGGDPEQFRLFFRRIRKMFPEEVAGACFLYIASGTSDPASQTMAFWLTSEAKNIRVLFDAAALPVEEATKAVVTLKKFDPDFSIKFLKAAEQVSLPAQLLRVLNLAPVLGDYSVLLAWIRKLSQHSDERVRSRAVKLLCELRPNKGQIERQMLSADTRVRASALEALWNKDLEWSADVLKAAASDAHHRVVANALVGLYLQGDQSAFARLIDLCQSPNHRFRSAMAWSLGFIGDTRAIPQLQALSKDPHIMVRKRAARSLLALLDENAQAKTDRVEARLPSESVEPSSAPNPSISKPSFSIEPETMPVPTFATIS